MLTSLLLVAGSLPLRPYPWLQGFEGPSRAGMEQSPDPLVRHQWTGTTNLTQMEIYNVTPVAVYTPTPESFTGLQSLTTSTPNVTVVGQGAFRVDFGVESAGWLELESDDLPDDANITMSVSEFDVRYPGKVHTPVRYGKVYRLETNTQLYEGVRFGFVWVVHPGRRVWHIQSVKVVAQTLPVPYTGSFSSPDAQLTKVWWVGAYCPKLNMLGPPISGALPPSHLAEGAILMYRGDRFGWTGDDHVSQMAIMMAFGQHDFVRQSLWNTHNQSNGILSYAVYWVMSVCDYYQQTGDTATLELYALNADAKLEQAVGLEGSASEWGENGSWKPAPLRFFGWDERLGAGFENASCLESQRDYSMLVIRACNEFAGALETLHDPRFAAMAKKHRGYAATITSNVRRSEKWYTDFGMHSFAEAVNARITLVEEEEVMFARLFNNSRSICSLSPFNMYWILQALGRMNKTEHAVGALKLCWGGMVELGGTTFWEAFTPDWTVLGVNGAVPRSQNGLTSLCHPWSSGATAWMTQHLLGVTPTSPGYSTIAITPLLGVVKGVVPTVRGDVAVEVNATSGRHSITTPRSAVVTLPCVGDVHVVQVNGTEVPHSVHPGGVVLTLPPGSHCIHVRYAGSLKAPPHTPVYPPMPWGAKCVGRDTTTGGQYVEKYGKDGYVAFSPTSTGEDTQQLPSYVVAVEVGGGKGTTSGLRSGPEVLEAPIAGLGSAFWGLASFNSYLDIRVATPAPAFNVSLYFCDWDAPSPPHPESGGALPRRVGVTLYDFETRDQVTPLEVVDSFRHGVWLSFRYSRSVRVRVWGVLGNGPVLSAVMFDT